MAKRKPADEKASSRGDYTVLARRYRPQQFRDLIGQEAVAQALANAIESGRVAHAYLFTGSRGVGKTSAARILAKALNCVNGPTKTPCGECELCCSIAAGEDVDVLEIDGASNRGIDEVREIRQNVQFRPARARYKIYIIDEVHMLTAPAFNALLKTLEEPPPNVKFIFATTEVQKIPITILSRCQRFDFGGIRLPRIVERLQQIVAAEGMQADDAALELIARRAGGSMRDAQSLLDQLLAFSAERLTTDSVHQLLGTAHEERIAALATAVLQKDAKQALAVLADLIGQGHQLGELLDQLIEYWRDLMVVRCAGDDGKDLSVGGSHVAALRQMAGGLTLDTIMAGLDLLAAAKARLRTTSHARVVLEMSLVRLAQLEDLVPLSQLVQWVSRPDTNPAAPTANSAVTPRPADAEKKKAAPEGDGTPLASTLPLTEANREAIWQQIMSRAGFALASDLRKVAKTAISGPNTLVLHVSEPYNSAGLDPTRLARLEPLLSEVVGQPCLVRLEMVRPDPGPPTLAAAAPSGPRQLREKVKQLPQVQKARELLGAEIVDIDADFGEVGAPPPDNDTAEE
jgi:DNA polymerase-3 subunit gamma/tau